MNIYEKIGLKRVINGSGKMTALGVSKISDTVAETMKEAGQNFVVIDDLIDRVGEMISKVQEEKILVLHLVLQQLLLFQ